MKANTGRLQLILTMMLFGTIGTISRFIDMPSSIICLVRAVVGAVVILLILAIQRKSVDVESIRKNIGWLTLSSVLLCGDWIFQFEAFKYTTIATSTVCYYMEPVFYILASVVVLKERVSIKKWICVLVAFAGMILVSGVIEVGFNFGELKGVIFAIAGGFFYAMVVLINKYINGVTPINTTITQLVIASIIMIPYTLVTGAFGEIRFTTIGIICVLILGALHRGIAYIFYFDCVNKLAAQTVGILSYIDPVVACLLSALFLKEEMTLWVLIGAVLILGATAYSQLGDKK